MLRPQLEAQRSVRGLDRIADTCDQGNARLGAAVVGLVGEGKHASGRGEECHPKQREPYPPARALHGYSTALVAIRWSNS